MRVALIAAGAGGMYCGSCLRDKALARAMRDLGHEVFLIPTYTPLRTDDEDDIGGGEVFYGGVNVYLQQHASLFRHTPRWLDGVLDFQPFLRAVTRHAGDADPAGLVEMTLSILAGEHGRQKKELHRLVRFLKNDVRPDIVNLPTALLVGLAERIRADVGVPVVCSLTGSDVFVDQMAPADGQRVKEMVRRRAVHADAFIATSRFYADYIAGYYGLPRGKIHVAPTGILLDGYEPARASSAATPLDGTRSPATRLAATRSGALGREPAQPGAAVLHGLQPGAAVPHESQPGAAVLHESQPGAAVLHESQPGAAVPHESQPGAAVLHVLTIGYFARVCRQKGLHVLADAFVRLRAMPAAPRCRLRAAGYLSQRDRAYLDDVRRQLDAAGLGADFEYVGEVDRAGKLAFLRGLDVFSVPTTFLEPKGLYVLEALASGVPVVLPAHGAFPEIVEETGGGVLVPPGDTDALATALLDLLRDGPRRAELGARGAAVVHSRRSAARMAAVTAEIYRTVLEARA